MLLYYGSSVATVLVQLNALIAWLQGKMSQSCNPSCVGGNSICLTANVSSGIKKTIQRFSCFVTGFYFCIMHGQLSSSSLSVLLWCNVAICLLPKLAHKVHIKNLFLGIERKHHLYHSRAHMRKKKKKSSICALSDDTCQRTFS